jgi:hypothetical protein
MTDHADKGWLMADEAEAYNREARARQEGLAFAGVFALGGFLGLALYDWTQGMEWAHALVALVYQVGPL